MANFIRKYLKLNLATGYEVTVRASEVEAIQNDSNGTCTIFMKSGTPWQLAEDYQQTLNLIFNS